MANSQSQQIWEEMLEGLPDSEHEFLDRVGRLRERGELEDASRRLDEALERNPTPRLRKVKGRIEIDRGNYTRAGEAVEPLCAPEDPDPDALIIYARTQGAAGDLDRALLTLQRARDAGAHPEEIARICREVEAFPDPTDENPVDGPSNPPHQSEPTLDVSEKWQELVESADSPDDLRRASKPSQPAASDHTKHTSESPVVRSSDAREDSHSRATAKSRAVQDSEADSDGDAPSGRVTAERQIDVPESDDEGGRSRIDSPHERVTAEAPRAERPAVEGGDDSEAESLSETSEEDPRLLEEYPTEEADDELLAAARSKSAMHREPSGPETDDNPFEEMEDTIAEVETSELDDPPDLDRPAGPADESSSIADSPGRSSDDPPGESGEIGRHLEKSDPDFYDNPEPTGIDHSVQSPGPDEPGTDDLPEASKEPSNVFQITTDPDATGLHLQDLLVDAPLDQQGTSTEDMSPSDFDEIETSPVHDYADVRDDFEIAEVETEGIIEEEESTQDVTPPDPAPRDSSTYRPEPSTLEEAGDGSDASTAPPGSDAIVETEQPTDPEVPGHNTSGGRNQQSTEPDLPGLRREPPTRERSGRQSRNEPESSSPAPADPLGDDDATRDRNRTNEIQESEPPSRRTDIPDGDTNPRQSTGRSDGARRNSTGGNAPGQRNTNLGTGPKVDPPPAQQRPTPAETNDRSADDRPPSPDGSAGRDRRTSGEVRSSDPRQRPRGGADQPSDRGPNRVQSGQSHVRQPAAEAEPKDADRSTEARRAEESGWMQQASKAVQLPESLSTWESLLIAAISFATVCVAVLFVSGLIASLDADRLAATLERTEKARASDTFQGWDESYNVAHTTLSEGPSPVRRFFQAVGGLLPGGNPRILQRELARQRAYTAAVLEYRYESYGSRHSKQYAEEIFGGPRVSGLAAAAATYRLLARGRYVQASGLAQSMHHDYKDNRQLARAYLEALIAADHTGDVVREARDLQDAGALLNIYDRFLIARAARFREDGSAREKLDTLIEEFSPQHLGARIERVDILVDYGELDEAKEQAQNLLNEYGKAASKHQRARLHVSLGHAYRAQGEWARAEEQYRAAVDVQPERPSVYVPLTELFINDGRLDEASSQIRAAESKAEITPRLQQLRARIQFLKGRLDSALSLLDGNAAGAMIAPVLRGRILLERGDYEKARKKLNSLGSTHPRYAAAQSVELLARAGMGVDDQEDALTRSDELQEQAPNDPLVLRSAARLRLHYARRASDTDERDAHLERAAELLDSAEETSTGHALLAYYRCELKLIAKSSEADRHCREAHRANSDYLPGRIILARLRLRQNTPAEAATLLESVRKQVGRRWDVDALTVRALVRDHRPSTAGDVLDDWAPTEQAQSPEFKLLEGLVAFAEADYQSAVGYFDKADNADGHATEAKLYHAHSLIRLGELERAVERVRDATRDPDWSGIAWGVFGELRRRQQQSSDALENLQFAARHFESEFVPAWRIAHLHAERALVWSQKEGWDDARVAEHLRRGGERGDPDAPDLLLAQGLYAMHRSNPNPENAARRLRAVADTQPYRCEAIEPLLELYRQLDEPDARADIAELEQENCE